MKKTILTIIVLGLIAVVGFFVFADDSTKRSANTEETATTTQPASAAPDGTYYFVTQERTTNEKGNPGPPEYAIKQKTPNGSSTVIFRFTDSEENRVTDWVFVAEQSEIILERQHAVERIDLKSKERTVIHKEGEVTPNPDEDVNRDCKSTVTGVTVTEDAAKIAVGRKGGFYCDTGAAILTFERQPSAEYLQTDKIVPDPEGDTYGFAEWANGTFVGGDKERMLTQFASCSKGPCPPGYRIFDFTTGNWQSESAFWDSGKRFATTDMLLPEVDTPTSAYALKVGRRAELKYCNPPEEGLALPGEVIRLHSVQTGDTNEVVGDATDGFDLLGFTTDGSHVLLERIQHENQDGCVENWRNTVGYSVLSLKSGELVPIESVEQWTQDQNTHVAYWRFGEMARELYVNGEQIGVERDVAAFLGFARGNQLIEAAEQSQGSASTGMQTYTSEMYGYSFEYPADWHEGNSDSAEFLQLLNYDVSRAEGGHSWPEGHNKIEGAVVDDNTRATSSDFPAESVSTSSQLVADFKTKRVQTLLQGGNQTRTYYIPLRNEADQYLALTIYGDPENFDVLEQVTGSFRFE